MEYTYSIQNDFPNHKVDMGTFIDELKSAYIPVENLIIQDDDVVIITQLDLTADQLDTVDDVISNHSGQAESPEEYIDKIKIVEESQEDVTQGIFQSTTIDIYISGTTGTTFVDRSFPFPISLFASKWLVSEDQISDVAEFHLAPNTVCGILTRPHYTGDTVLHVNDTVFTQAHMRIGYYITVNGQDLGRVISKNEMELTITVENPLPIDMAAGSYVFFTIKMVPFWRFNAPGFCSVGESKIGSSLVPANTIMRMVYHNNSGKPKWFSFSIDYLY